MDAIPPIMEAILHGHSEAGLGRYTRPDKSDCESTEPEHDTTLFRLLGHHTVYPKGTL